MDTLYTPDPRPSIVIISTIYDALLSNPSERELADLFGIDRARFLRHFERAVVAPCVVAGELAGGMMFLDGRVHIGILPPFRSRWFRQLKPMLEIGFAAFGPRLLAPVNRRSLAVQRFVEQVGCVKLRELPMYIEYEVMKERMRYERNRGCVGGRIRV